MRLSIIKRYPQGKRVKKRSHWGRFHRLLSREATMDKVTQQNVEIAEESAAARKPKALGAPTRKVDPRAEDVIPLDEDNFTNFFF